MSTTQIHLEIEQRARAHQDTLTKPRGALGRLEDVACWFAARQGKILPDALVPHIAVFAGDHGVDDARRQLKIDVVAKALQRIADIRDADVLQQVGGLEIAAMAGFYLEAAESGVPVLIDGFIAAAAALAAGITEPAVSDWMLASHVSHENGHALALEALGLKALIDFEMRLGEGSGAALVVPLLQSAIALHNKMATFESAGVSEKNE